MVSTRTHLPSKQGVAGSIPAGRAIPFKGLLSLKSLCWPDFNTDFNMEGHSWPFLGPKGLAEMSSWGGVGASLGTGGEKERGPGVSPHDSMIGSSRFINASRTLFADCLTMRAKPHSREGMCQI